VLVLFDVLTVFYDDQWRSQKLGLGVQLDIIMLNIPLSLKICWQNTKTPPYLVLGSFRLGGANAPLHPLWLRY